MCYLGVRRPRESPRAALGRRAPQRAWVDELPGPLREGSGNAPGPSGAAQAGDAGCCLETRRHRDGLCGRNDKHRLFPVAVRKVDFPTAGVEAGLAVGRPWPLALSVRRCQFITQSARVAVKLPQPAHPPGSEIPLLPAVTWVEMGQLELWSWGLPGSFVDSSAEPLPFISRVLGRAQPYR